MSAATEVVGVAAGARVLRAARIHARAGARSSRRRDGEGGGTASTEPGVRPASGCAQCPWPKVGSGFAIPPQTGKGVSRAGPRGWYGPCPCPACARARPVTARPGPPGPLELSRLEMGHRSELWAHHRSSEPHPLGLAQVTRATAGYVAP